MKRPTPDQFPPPPLDEEDEPLECLDDYGDNECKGPVEYRCPLSPSGRAFPRCEHHWELRLDKEENMIPDSDVAPAWLDPSYAGERWEDDY